MMEDERTRGREDESRELEWQERLDAGGEVTDGAGLAAYRLVYAALADDTGFALPPDFAAGIVARAMPVEPFPWYERVLLPVLLVIASAITVPAIIAQTPRVLQALEAMAEPVGGIGMVVLGTLALVLLAGVDRLAGRRLGVGG